MRPDHVNDSVRCARRLLSREDVGDAIVEEAVHVRAVANVVVEICRPVANLMRTPSGVTPCWSEYGPVRAGMKQPPKTRVDGVKAVDLVGNLTMI